MTFPLIEELRRDLQAEIFTRLTDEEVAGLRSRLAMGHHSNVIEGIKPTQEMVALFEMILQERAPLAIAQPYLDRYIRVRLVG